MGVACTAAQPTHELPMRWMTEKRFRSISCHAITNVIKIEGRIRTTLPVQLQEKFKNYETSYSMKYGDQHSEWTEYCDSIEYVNQRAYSFEYILNSKEQTLKVELEFKPRPGSQTNNLINDAVKKEGEGDSENPDQNFMVINLSAEFNVHNLLMANGEFLAPAHFDDSKLRASLAGEETKTDMYDNTFPPLMISLKESKPDNTKKIRFTLRGKFKKKNYVMVTLYEIVGNNKKFIYETSPTLPDTMKNGLNYFDPIEINTDWFEDEMVSTKIIEFEAKEIIPGSQQNAKIKPFCSWLCKVKDLISITDGQVIQKDMLSKSKKVVGNLLLSESTIQPAFSFLDFKIHRGINIVPIIAIDYSLSNLTFDDQKCIHSLKKGANNDYISVIEHITNAYQNISTHMLGFGMGARTIPKKGETSNWFSLTGNIFNPVIKKDKLFEHYGATLKRVELSLPVNYHNILELASAYAKYETEKYEARNYYVLIYVSVGVIDDFQQTLEVLKDISDLPLTVIMVRVRNMQMEDTNDPAILIKECANSFAACEREYLDIIDYEVYKKQQKLDVFENELVSRIPFHVQKYMEIHNVFAYDIDTTDYASRVSIALKKQQVLADEGFAYQDDVCRRQSMVNIKEFIQDIRQREYKERTITEDTEEDKEENTQDTKDKSSVAETEDSKYTYL